MTFGRTIFVNQNLDKAPRVLDMNWENHDINVVEYANFPKFPPLVNGDQEIQKIFFDFLIIVFELVALNTRFYLQKILFIGCEYLKKQSQDFSYY